MTDTLSTLRRFRACQSGLEWVKAQLDQTPQALWDACPDGAWLGWWLDEIDDPRGRLATCACARCALPHAGKWGAVCRSTIETVERYSRGEATEEELSAARIRLHRAAADSARASARADGAVAAAAWAAESVVALAAASRDATWAAEAAADAAGYAAKAAGQDPEAARREMLARCAEAIRAIVPVCPVPKEVDGE